MENDSTTTIGATAISTPLSNNSSTMVAAGAGIAANGLSAGSTESTSYQSSFTVKFSATTEMILKRLREGGPLSSNAAAGAGNTGPYQVPGYEDVRRSVLQGMRTSMNMDMPVTTPITKKKGPSTVKSSTTSGPSTPTASPAIGSSATFSVNPAAAIVNPSIPTPTTGGTASKGRTAAKVKGKAGTKRKRAKDESDSELSDAIPDLGGDSDSEEVTQLPTQTLSGRRIVKPTQFVPAPVEGPARKKSASKMNRKNFEQALCKRCGRGHSPASNMIVFCDGCNLGWHQMCHDPAVSNEVIKDESKQWFCKDCEASRAAAAAKRRQEAAKVTSQVVTDLTWSKKSAAEKRAYLELLPHSILVDLHLQAVNLHPDLSTHVPPPSASPYQTPANSQPTALAAQQPSPPTTNNQPSSAPRPKSNQHTQAPFPPSATAGLFTRAESNPTAPINFIRKLTPAGSASYIPTQTTTAAATAPLPTSTPTPAAAALLEAQADANGGGGNEGEQDRRSRASTPDSPPYPKPGNGLMARLPPDDQDLEWLRGGGEDDEAFSHMVWDRVVDEDGVETRVKRYVHV